MLRRFLLSLSALNLAVVVASVASFYAVQSHAPLDTGQFQHVTTVLRNQPGEQSRANLMSLLEKTDRLMRSWTNIAKYLTGISAGVAILNVGMVFLCLTNMPVREAENELT